MKIHLNEQEIIQALKEFISNQGISITGKSVEVHLTAGRGSNGHKADLEITDEPGLSVENAELKAKMAEDIMPEPDTSGEEAALDFFATNDDDGDD
jgi:hypothetical protein